MRRHIPTPGTHRSFPPKKASSDSDVPRGAPRRQGAAPSLVRILFVSFFSFLFLFFLALFLAAGRLFKVANKFHLMKPEKPELGAKRNKSNQYRRHRKRILKAGLGIITC